MSLRYEVWDEPWNAGGFARRIARLPVMPGTGTGDVRFLSTGGAGQAEVALAQFDRMDEVVGPTVGSMIRVLDGETIVAEWLPQRTPKNLVGAAKTASLSGNNLVSVFDQVVNYAREYPNLVSEIQDTVWAGRNILSDPGFEDARVEPEIYEIKLDGATGGTFTLTVHGATTIAIAYNAVPLTVELALQGIGTPTINDVLVDDTADGYTIEFVDPAVPDADMTWTPSLTGGGGDWELEITQIGRLDAPASWTKSQYADQSSNPRVHGRYASLPGGFQLVGPTYPQNGPVRTGNSSLRVNGLTQYAGIQQVIDVEPGMTYQASIWARTTDATEVFKLVIRDIYEKWIAQDAGLISGADTWTNYETSFTVPDDRDQVIFRMAQTVDQNPLPFYLDDAEVLEGDAAATPGVILITVLDDITIDHAGDPRGALLTWIDYSSFTTTDDSNSNPWSDSISFTAYYGETLGQILDKMVNKGFEWELVPKAAPSGGKTHDLKVYNNGGRDATPSTAITIRQGVLGGEIVDRIPSFTAILAQGSGNIFYEDESAAAGDFGRFEKFLPDRDTGDVAGLTLLADSAFAEEAANRRAARFSIAETPYHARPGINYVPGDTIPMQSPPALSRELRRVVSFDYANTFPSTYSVTGSTILQGDAAAYELVRRMWRRFVPVPRERRSGVTFGLAGSTIGLPTVFVAAASASEDIKRTANYVCDGVDDQEEIQKALTEVFDGGGGRVLLSQGLFTISDGMSYPDVTGNSLLFTGMGHSTNIHFDAAGGSPASRVMFSISGGTKDDIHIIRDMRFTTETDADTATKAIFIQAWGLIQGIRFDDTTEEQILVFGDTGSPKMLIIKECLFKDGVQHIEVNKGSCFITLNHFFSASNTAILVESPNQEDELITLNRFTENVADITDGLIGSHTATHNVFDNVHVAGDHGALADTTAIHDNIAAEISAIAEKTVPISTDLVLIEDSAASDAKKKVQIGNLPGGDGGGGGSGGGSSLVEGFGEDNLAASLTNSQLYRNVQGIEAQLPVVMPRAGSIIGLSIASSEARTAGTATFEVYKNGAATGLTAVLDGTDTQYAYAVQAASLDTFVAGDRLDVRVTTDGTWAPTTADVEAVITTTDGALVVPQWINYLAARQPDETPHVDDDFFDSDSSSDYTELDIDSGITNWAIGRGRLGCVFETQTVSDFGAFLKSITSASSPMTIETALLLDRGNDKFAYAGILFSDGVTATDTATSAGLIIETNATTNEPSIRHDDGTLTLMAAQVVDQRAQAAPGQLRYLQLIWISANSFKIRHSIDGVNWIDLGAQATTLTPTKFGFFVTDWGGTATNEGLANFEYFRVYDSDESV